MRGSDYTHYAGPLANGATEVVTLTTGHSVFGGILVCWDDTLTNSSEVEYLLEDADGNDIHLFRANHTISRTLRDGMFAGPWGLRSENGLQVRIQNLSADTGVKATFLHRNLT